MADKTIRTARGAASSELAPVIFLLLFLFVFPMINLGMLATRYALAMTACREAAHQAAVSYTFESGTSARPSAMDAAKAAVDTVVSRFSGINVKSQDVDIISSNIVTQAVDRHKNKLKDPANTQQNIYSLETSMVCELEPLIRCDTILGAVPGLTGPYTVSLYAREFAENPQGLNQ